MSHHAHHHSLLTRIRNTPKSIRRKFVRPSSISTSSSPSNSAPTSPVLQKKVSEDIPDYGRMVEESIQKRESKDSLVSFKCSYLGEFPLYTANPEHCYQHARVIAQCQMNKEESLQRKCRILINSTSLEVIELNDLLRLDSGKRKGRYKPQKAEPQTRSTPITVFDANAICMNKTNKQVPVSTKISLYNIAYSVAIPSDPRIFVVTSKQDVYLCCRVFYFNKPEKAQAATLQLAKHFQRLYQNWNKNRTTITKDLNDNHEKWGSNSSFSSSSSDEKSLGRLHNSCENIYKASKNESYDMRPRTSSEGQKFKIDRSSLLKLASLKNAKKRSSSDDETSSSGSSKTSSPVFLRMPVKRPTPIPENSEEVNNNITHSCHISNELQHKEFKRRESCYEQPDQLPLGNETLESLEEKLENVELKSTSSDE